MCVRGDNYTCIYKFIEIPYTTLHHCRFVAYLAHGDGCRVYPTPYTTPYTRHGGVVLMSRENGSGTGRVAEPREHPLREIAARDCRGTTSPEEAERLRSPEWLSNWYVALVELQRDVEAQLTERKHEYDSRRAEVRSLTYFDPEWSLYQKDYFLGASGQFAFSPRLRLANKKPNSAKKTSDNSVRGERKNCSASWRPSCTSVASATETRW